jgi:hypothetical protein
MKSTESDQVATSAFCIMFVFLFLAAHFDVSLLPHFAFTIIHYVFLFFPFLSLVAGYGFGQNTGMRSITTFRSATDRIYDGGPVRL